MPRLAVLAGVLAAADCRATAAQWRFDGSFVRGVEMAAPAQGNKTDEVLTFLQLVDVARRQYSADEFEYQSVNQLYRGDWDGVMEGPTWGAWCVRACFFS